MSDIINNKNIILLGVILDPHLTFKDHITNKSKIEIALCNLSLICKIRNFLRANQLKMLMHSFVCTHLDYCNAILVNSPDIFTKQFQLVQNFAAKNVLNKKNQDSATECLMKFHWLPLKFRCIYKLLEKSVQLPKEGRTNLSSNKIQCEAQ